MSDATQAASASPIDDLGRALQKAARKIARRAGRSEPDVWLPTLPDAPRAVAERVLAGDSAQLTSELLADPDGIRWAFRALNALERLDSELSCSLTHALLEGLSQKLGASELGSFWVKMAMRLRAPLGESGRKLVALCVSALESGAVEDTSAWLLLEALVAAQWVPVEGMEARLASLKPWVPTRLDSEHRTYLERSAEHARGHWSRRLAAVWLLACAGGASYQFAMLFLREAHNRLPIEVLEVIEALQYVVSLDPENLGGSV